MRARFLIEVIVLSSVYSALLTAIFVSLDALDVAMTEAAVGVGVTTTLFLATLKLVGNNADSFKKVSYISLFNILRSSFSSGDWDSRLASLSVKLTLQYTSISLVTF